jgi:hypothetical protein
MAVYSLKEAPDAVQELVGSARKGNITPLNFCQELTRLGIEGPIKMFYVRDAFGLPLEEAKKLVIEYDYGSVDAWGEQLMAAIDELASEVEEENPTK